MRRSICNLLSFLPGKEKGLTLKVECRKRGKKRTEREKRKKKRRELKMTRVSKTVYKWASGTDRRK